MTAFLTIFGVCFVLAFLFTMAIADDFKEQIILSAICSLICAAGLTGMMHYMRKSIDLYAATEINADGYRAMQSWVSRYPGALPKVRKAMSDGKIVHSEYDALSTLFKKLDDGRAKSDLANAIK